MNLDAVVSSLDDSLAAYRADYAAYYERCKQPNSPAMRDPNAVVYLVPGRRHAHLRQGQGDGADRGGVLRQRHQCHARRRKRQPLRRASPSRRRSTSNTGCSRRPSSSACRSRNRSPAASRCITGGAGGIGAGDRRSGCMGEGACVVLADIDSASLEAAVAEFRQARSARTPSPARVADVTDEDERSRRRFARRRRRLRRPRHPRRQRRHRLGRAVRGHLAGALEPQHRHPRDRLFPDRARGYRIMKEQGLGGSDRLRRLEERARGLAGRLGLLHGQGGGGASGPLPRARGRAARHPGQHRQSRRGAARLEDLAGRMARAARRVEQGRRDGARGGLPPALAAEALGLSGGHRRGGLFLRLRPVGEDRPATSSTSTPATRSRSPFTAR